MRPHYLFLFLSFVLLGCTFDRAEQANSARIKLIGFSRAQVADCMGAADAKSVTPTVEQWTYMSKDSDKLFCRVDVIIDTGRVAEIRYSGHTGGLLTENEQCATVVARCLPSRPNFSNRVMKVFSF